MRLILSIISIFSVLFISCTNQETKQGFVESSNTQNEAKAEISNKPSGGNYFRPVILSGQPEQIIHRTAYTLSYNKDWVNCNWVYWILTREHCKGNAKRSNEQFTEDNEVKGRKATDRDYVQSGYDRGHMCPAGDNQWDKKAMSETFKLSNICPQSHNLNTGDWNDLEQACRFWAKKYGELHIVCGPIYYNNVKNRLKNKVGVPDAFFKCIVRTGNNPSGLGFIYKNNGKHHEMDYYVCSIDKVEETAKINVFKGLPNEAKIEANANLSDWYHFDPDYSKNRDRNNYKDDNKSGGKKKHKNKNKKHQN